MYISGVVFCRIVFRSILKKENQYTCCHRRCSKKKGVLKNFSKFKGKHLCQSLVFNKVEACNFIKKETMAQVFFCEFCKNFKNTFFSKNTAVSASVSDYHMKWWTSLQPSLVHVNICIHNHPWSLNNVMFWFVYICQNLYWSIIVIVLGEIMKAAAV